VDAQLRVASHRAARELRNVQPHKALPAYYEGMGKKDLAVALTGADTLDRHVRGQREADGGDLTGTVYDVDSALQGLDRAKAVMANVQEAMDRGRGSAEAAAITHASAEAARRGVDIARDIQAIRDWPQLPDL
jgi:hypothetical protein